MEKEKEEFHLGRALKPYLERLGIRGSELWRGVLRSNGMGYRPFVRAKGEHVDRVKAELRSVVGGLKVEADEQLKLLLLRETELTADLDALITVDYEVPDAPKPAAVKEPYVVDSEGMSGFLNTLNTTTDEEEH